LTRGSDVVGSPNVDLPDGLTQSNYAVQADNHIVFLDIPVGVYEIKIWGEWRVAHIINIWTADGIAGTVQGGVCAALSGSAELAQHCLPSGEGAGLHC
jgi:hypothetical protein